MQSVETACVILEIPNSLCLRVYLIASKVKSAITRVLRLVRIHGGSRVFCVGCVCWVMEDGLGDLFCFFSFLFRRWGEDIDNLATAQRLSSFLNYLQLLLLASVR